MKHNPRLGEKVARLPGFADVHPFQPESTVQGALELIDQTAHWLKVLTGMPAIAMSPAAGAHGEFCGLMTIRAALEDKGEKRTPGSGSGIGAWHQSGQRRRLRFHRRGDSRQWARPGRSGGLEGQAGAGRRRGDADQSQHLRSV